MANIDVESSHGGYGKIDRSSQIEHTWLIVALELEGVMSLQLMKRLATTDDVVKAVEVLGCSVDRRLTLVEQGQKTLVADVAALKTDVAALKTDVAALKTDVAALKTDVAGLKTDVASLKEGQIILLENQVLLKREVGDVKRGVDAILAHLKITQVA
ncbi:MAG: hypothetical protein WCK65_00800 [Rhodospirillaceae bacterium]